jgi:hypothetical protein
MATQQPDYRAFTVIKRGEGVDDFWLPIGAAFAHQDGTGFNIVLQALPIDGKIVLRQPKADEQAADSAARPSGQSDRQRSGQKRR